MYQQILELLKSKNIILEEGLTAKELDQIYKIYDIEFPTPLQDFLRSMLPISKGFYHWRNFSRENVAFIKTCMEFPAKDICNRTDEVDWCDHWGVEPKNKKKREVEIKKKALAAPKLVPIYSHRYIPLGHFNSYPILSIHGVDIIYYGKDLENYINIEFGTQKQAALDYRTIEYIPFWTDLM